MSIPGIIYCIGGICSIIIMAYVFFNDFMEDEDIKVKDLGLLLILEFCAFCLSWVLIAVTVFVKCEDKVVIKRKKKR
jgi:hypothetical protein